jgi:hypothetical protein
MEGDNRQRRARAAEAREHGTTPSEAGVTTGASKQIRHLPNSADHEDKLSGPGRGKQQPERAASEPRPHSIPSQRPREGGQSTPPDPRDGAVAGELDALEGQVLTSIARLETEEGSASVAAIARDCHIPEEAAEQAVVTLMRIHDVVVELADDPRGGAGPAYLVKPRGS